MRDFKSAAANDLDQDFERALAFDDYLEDRRAKAPVASLVPTEAELFGQDFVEWKRGVIADCDLVDKILAEKFGKDWEKLLDKPRKRPGRA